MERMNITLDMQTDPALLDARVHQDLLLGHAQPEQYIFRRILAL